MKDLTLFIEKGKRGYLIDGREYEIVSLPGLAISINGNFRYSDIELSIDGELHTLRISEFLSIVATINDLCLRDLEYPKENIPLSR